MNNQTDRSNAGFSLIELMVVISIILILLTATAGLFGFFGRDRALNGSAEVLAASFMQVRGMAGKSQTTHFLVFKNQGYEIFIDKNKNDRFDSADRIVEGKTYELKGSTFFVKRPNFIGFRSSGGALILPGGYTDMPSTQFENKLAAGNPDGDIVISNANTTQHCYIDFVGLTGMVRRIHVKGAD